MSTRFSGIRRATALATVALGTVALASPAPSAQATDVAAAPAANCGGNLIDSIKVKRNGKVIGELDVYHQGGTNCARMNHSGETWGKRLRTSVYIAACKETRPANICHPVSNPAAEDGWFTHYAGPKSVQARNHCIHAAGDIYYLGKKYHAQTNPIASHCK